MGLFWSFLCKGRSPGTACRPLRAADLWLGCGDADVLCARVSARVCARMRVSDTGMRVPTAQSVDKPYYDGQDRYLHAGRPADPDAVHVGPNGTLQLNAAAFPDRDAVRRYPVRAPILQPCSMISDWRGFWLCMVLRLL